MVYRTGHRPGPPDRPDPKGLGRVEWMLGSGLGPIFGSALGLGRFYLSDTLVFFFTQPKTRTFRVGSGFSLIKPIVIGSG